MKFLIITTVILIFVVKAYSNFSTNLPLPIPTTNSTEYVDGDVIAEILFDFYEAVNERCVATRYDAGGVYRVDPLGDFVHEELVSNSVYVCGTYTESWTDSFAVVHNVTHTNWCMGFSTNYITNTVSEYSIREALDDQNLISSFMASMGDKINDLIPWYVDHSITNYSDYFFTNSAATDFVRWNATSFVEHVESTYTQDVAIADNGDMFLLYKPLRYSVPYQMIEAKSTVGSWVSHQVGFVFKGRFGRLSNTTLYPSVYFQLGQTNDSVGHPITSMQSVVEFIFNGELYPTVATVVATSISETQTVSGVEGYKFNLSNNFLNISSVTSTNTTYTQYGDAVQVKQTNLFAQYGFLDDKSYFFPETLNAFYYTLNELRWSAHSLPTWQNSDTNWVWNDTPNSGAGTTWTQAVAGAAADYAIRELNPFISFTVRPFAYTTGTYEDKSPTPTYDAIAQRHYNDLQITDLSTNTTRTAYTYIKSYPVDVGVPLTYGVWNDNGNNVKDGYFHITFTNGPGNFEAFTNRVGDINTIPIWCDDPKTSFVVAETNGAQTNYYNGEGYKVTDELVLYDWDFEYLNP